MLATHPWPGNVPRGTLADCIEACAECAQACTSCADACLSEQNVLELRKCIRLNLDCADVCAAMERVLTRQTEYDAPTSITLLYACWEICSTCAEECEEHIEIHDHCGVCADACRRCQTSCDRLLITMK
jgi:hypothetical protein